jgi:hypothetical protein
MTRALILAALLTLSACDLEQPTQAGEEMPLLMPMTTGRWVKQGPVWILELSHGWLVRPPQGYAEGLCFVPKPSTTMQQ